MDIIRRKKLKKSSKYRTTPLLFPSPITSDILQFIHLIRRLLIRMCPSSPLSASSKPPTNNTQKFFIHGKKKVRISIPLKSKQQQPTNQTHNQKKPNRNIPLQRLHSPHHDLPSHTQHLHPRLLQFGQLARFPDGGMRVGGGHELRCADRFVGDHAVVAKRVGAGSCVWEM